jgi:hypothetical protein
MTTPTYVLVHGVGSISVVGPFESDAAIRDCFGDVQAQSRVQIEAPEEYSARVQEEHRLELWGKDVRTGETRLGYDDWLAAQTPVDPVTP